MIIQPTGPDSVISKVTGGFLSRAGYTHAIGPYVGCGHTCNYCYATQMVAGQEPTDPATGERAVWGRWVKPKLGSGERIRRMRNSLADAVIYMSPATDPYCPQERQYRITREVLEALADRHGGVRLCIQTRGPLVTRDIDVLSHLDRLGQVQVNMTISTDNEERKHALEPASPSLEQRWKAVGKLSEAGLSTVVTVTPFLGLDDPQGFLHRLKDNNIHAIIMQDLHDPQAVGQRSHGTPGSITENLQKLGISPESLRKDMQSIGEGMSAQGIEVRWNDAGFTLPDPPQRLRDAPLFTGE